MFKNNALEDLGGMGWQHYEKFKHSQTKRVTTMQNKELQALSDKKGDNNAK